MSFKRLAYNLMVVLISLSGNTKACFLNLKVEIKVKARDMKNGTSRIGYFNLVLSTQKTRPDCA